MTSIIFAKHAQHVVLIHFPIALFLTAVAFDFYAQWARDQGVAAAAYLNLLLAAVTTIPVLATGLGAWAWALEGQRLKGTLLMHLVLGIASSAVICATWWIHWRARRTPTNPLPAYRLPLEAAGVGLWRGRDISAGFSVVSTLRADAAHRDTKKQSGVGGGSLCDSRRATSTPIMERAVQK